MSSLFEGIGRFINNTVADFADAVQTDLDPRYRRMKKVTEGVLHVASAGALLTFVVSAVSGISGLGYCVAGKPGHGVNLLTSSAISTWLCFNLYKISDNAKPIANNPQRYTTLLGEIDEPVLKKQLQKGTFCFAPFVDFIIFMTKNIRGS